eukprot:TRINITY_DN13010_c0_g1_i2.p1 TRINITY_DN13010_c0_g1~~TRINITY_DN13010_c0_g1_i2.p1  ORF type:complete len:2282 (+),score=662.87 TRINITY_DN13010_c0_g1_i2:93-6848(+)
MAVCSGQARDVSGEWDPGGLPVFPSSPLHCTPAPASPDHAPLQAPGQNRAEGADPTQSEGGEPEPEAEAVPYSLHNYTFEELKRAHRVAAIGPGRLREDDNFNTLSPAFGCVGARHPARLVLIHLCDNKWFDRAVLLLIVLNSVTLALGDPSLQGHSGIQSFLAVCEWVFLAAFTAEAVVKIGARGLLRHDGAYLRQSWRVLDFIIVLVGWVSVFTSSDGNVGAVRVLRAFRIVRPLRSISRIRKMRELMATLMNSLPLVMNVFIMLLFVVWVFAILGVILFAGSLHHRCYLPAGSVVPDLGSDAPPCVGGPGDRTLNASVPKWKDALPGGARVLTRPWLVCNATQWACGRGLDCSSNGLTVPQECRVELAQYHYGWLSYDNIFSAALLVLKAASLDDWPDDMALAQQHNGHHAWLFFFVVTLIGQYFVFSLVLAVLTKAFSDERNNRGLETVVPPVIVDMTAAQVCGAAAVHPILIVAARIFVHDNRLMRCIAYEGLPFWSCRPPGAEEIVQLRCDFGDVVEVCDEQDGWARGWPVGQRHHNGGRGYWLQLVAKGVPLFEPVDPLHHSLVEAEEGSSWAPAEDEILAEMAGLAVCDVSRQRSRLGELPQGRRSVLCQMEIDRARRRLSGKGTTDRRSSVRSLSHRSRSSILGDPFPRSVSCATALSIPVILPPSDAHRSRAPSAAAAAALAAAAAAVAEHPNSRVWKLHSEDGTAGAPPSGLGCPLTPPSRSHARLSGSTGPRAVLGIRRQTNSTDGAETGAGSTELRTPLVLPAAQASAPSSRAVSVGLMGADRPSASGESLLHCAKLPSTCSGFTRTPISKVSNATTSCAHGYAIHGRAGGHRDLGARGSVFAALGDWRVTSEIHSEGDLPWWRRLVRRMVLSSWFSGLFVLVTLVNVAALAMLHYPGDEAQEELISLTNFVCSIVFLCECILKLAGLGRSYFKDKYNVFDFFLVLSSLPALAGVGLMGLNALRALRLNRVFRLFRVFTQLRHLVTSIVMAIKDVLWLSLLILLYIFIYGVLGMSLFSERPQEPLEHMSFTSFGESCLTVFVLMTGEGWGSVLKNSMEQYSWPSAVYFVSNFLIGNCVLLSLFVAILIDNFTRVTRVAAQEMAEAEEQPEGDAAADAVEAARRVLLVAKHEGLTPPQPEHGATANHTQLAPPGSAPPFVSIGPSLGAQVETLDNNQPPGTSPMPGSGAGAGAALAAFRVQEQEPALTELEKRSSFEFDENEECREPQDPRRAGAQGLPDLEFAGFGARGRGMRLRRKIRRCITGDSTPVLLGHSLGLFGADSGFRIGLSRVVFHPVFSNLVILLILVNAVFIALDTPELEDNERLQDTIRYSDVAFAVVFILECFLKIIVLGFFWTPSAYTKDKWNCADLVAAVIAVAGVFVPSLKPLRVVRTVRLVVRLREVRMIVESLIAVIPNVANVFFLLLAFLLVWAILGVHLFNGNQWSCSDERDPPLTYEQCNGSAVVRLVTPTAFGDVITEAPGRRRWRSHSDYNFDNVGSAVFTLFLMAVGDGWQRIMFDVMDSPGREEPPRLNARWWSSLYFVVFIVVGQFFFMNLFVGLLLETLLTIQDEKHKEQQQLTPLQECWLQAQKIAVKHPPEAIVPAPGSSVRRLCHSLTTGRWPYRYELSVLPADLGDRPDDEPLGYADRAVKAWCDSSERLAALPLELADGYTRRLPAQLPPGTELRARASCLSRVYVVVDPRSDGALCRVLPEEGWVDCAEAPMLRGSYDAADSRRLRMYRRTLSGGCHVQLPPLRGAAAHLAVVFVPSYGEMTNRFDLFTTAMILLNAVVLSGTHYDQPEGLTESLLIANYVFVGIFTAEAAIKICGVGYRHYASDSWNRFDFLLVSISLLSFAPQVQTSGATILRLFRIGRLLRLLKRAKGLRTLFQALVSSLRNLAHVVVFLLILFFMFSAVGVDLFGRVNSDVVSNGDSGLTPLLNFKNVYYAFVTLYALASLESWTTVMEACSLSEPDCYQERGDCGPSVAVSRIYFSVFVIMGGFLTVNLFVTVVVQGFDETSAAAVQQEVLQALAAFHLGWQRLDPAATRAVDARRVLALLMKLPEPLWITHRGAIAARQTTEFANTLKQLKRMALPLNKDLKVHYCDAVSTLSARLYGLDVNAAREAARHGPWAMRGDCWELVHWVACRRISSAWAQRQAGAMQGSISSPSFGPPGGGFATCLLARARQHTETLGEPVGATPGGASGGEQEGRGGTPAGADAAASSVIHPAPEADKSLVS